MIINFVCVNVGPKYPMTYVEHLRDMVFRNATRLDDDCAFWCITDRPEELPEGVYGIPADPDLPGWWQKVRLFAPEMPWNLGDRCVYFDLDVCITGRLEDLVTRKGIIKDWHWPCYNSSVMVWDHGEHRCIWTEFRSEIMALRSPPEMAKLLPDGQINGGDQEWITYQDQLWDTFPPAWFVSYRTARLWPPNECKAVIFHGDPKPHEIEDGWVPNVWKVGGYTSLPADNGVNTSIDQRMENARSACLRDLPWFTGYRPHKRQAVIVGGGPSVKDCLPDIKAKKRAGHQIITVNNAWRYLVDHGVMPDRHVMVDGRPDNAAFVRDAPKSIRFLLASQVHPDVFDALKDHEVIVWHNGFNENSEIMDVLKPWWDPGPNQRPCILIPGGSTVVLRALWLAHESGFRTIHVYGMDGSYADDGQHHAYAQPLNDQETVVPVVLGGKRYRCALWMTRQAEEFRITWFDLKERGTKIFVHGTGLVPDIARKLRVEERNAA